MAKPVVKMGRPTAITPEIESKLESILKIGGTIAEATTYAGIGERTYYDRVVASEDFSRKMAAAKHYADVAAKNVVVASITKDSNLDSAKWWLEKREFRQSNNTINVSGEKVIAILGGAANVQEDNSDKPDS